ncbi:FAD-dependent oxidoreductase (GlcD/DLD domain protein) [Natronomonas pharaonis DSM 2160]|uniref:D-lactate dehydrogenase (cytochrome) n=1 Tax=Natronomonas pharaonis (strain ATCC 35678 / DSM 2160 / CIP 103997 / JCM 8858 / NBRC 14720 / NCIMB 2260 / Gabara) TaxID=348780 RepID=A0A1U7EXP8_NATPD|nr:FAD-binding oxidoreductase [Natronomonas pharaonis]CAI49973.2 FAD-dependent oxidoreductase (GlcD/DLD domain protein) [Natronomonas pharaonis DSM 2160]
MPHDCSFLDGLALEGDVSFNEGERENHAADWVAEEAGFGVTPDAVVWPASTADVSAVLAAANEHGVPVTPYAAGTSLEGNAVPLFRGISMDMTKLDSVLAVRPDDFQIDVEPGVMGSAVDAAAADHGLFFPPMPSSGNLSTIGGMIANDASGQKTVRYGEVADWILELEVVLADGTVIETGSKAVKTSSGYNLKDLIIGSEGTLGVVTRATLELEGRPEQIQGGRAVFASVDAAAEAVSDVVQSGVDVAKLELLDPLAAEMANEYFDTGLPEGAMIFFEFHANHGIDEEVAFFRTVLEAHDVTEFEIADEDRMDELWRARDELAFAIQQYDPELSPRHPGDVTVPLSDYPEMVRYIRDLGEEYDVLLPCFGHAGDGNIHYTVLVDQDDGAMVETAEEIYDAIVERALEHGGTATGEHGIGMGKRRFLEAEHGEGGVAAMRAVKAALDPTDILNPGKIFPETEPEGGRVNLPGR